MCGRGEIININATHCILPCLAFSFGCEGLCPSLCKQGLLLQMHSLNTVFCFESIAYSELEAGFTSNGMIPWESRQMGTIKPILSHTNYGPNF